MDSESKMCVLYENQIHLLHNMMREMRGEINYLERKINENERKDTWRSLGGKTLYVYMILLTIANMTQIWKNTIEYNRYRL